MSDSGTEYKKYRIDKAVARNLQLVKSGRSTTEKEFVCWYRVIDVCHLKTLLRKKSFVNQFQGHKKHVNCFHFTVKSRTFYLSTTMSQVLFLEYGWEPYGNDYNTIPHTVMYCKNSLFRVFCILNTMLKILKQT